MKFYAYMRLVMRGDDEEITMVAQRFTVDAANKKEAEFIAAQQVMAEYGADTLDEFDIHVLPDFHAWAHEVENKNQKMALFFPQMLVADNG